MQNAQPHVHFLGLRRRTFARFRRRQFGISDLKTGWKRRPRAFLPVSGLGIFATILGKGRFLSHSEIFHRVRDWPEGRRRAISIQRRVFLVPWPRPPLSPL